MHTYHCTCCAGMLTLVWLVGIYKCRGADLGLTCGGLQVQGFWPWSDLWGSTSAGVLTLVWLVGVYKCRNADLGLTCGGLQVQECWPWSDLWGSTSAAVLTLVWLVGVYKCRGADLGLTCVGLQVQGFWPWSDLWGSTSAGVLNLVWPVGATSAGVLTLVWLVGVYKCRDADLGLTCGGLQVQGFWPWSDLWGSTIQQYVIIFVLFIIIEECRAALIKKVRSTLVSQIHDTSAQAMSCCYCWLSILGQL